MESTPALTQLVAAIACLVRCRFGTGDTSTALSASLGTGKTLQNLGGVRANSTIFRFLPNPQSPQMESYSPSLVGKGLGVRSVFHAIENRYNHPRTIKKQEVFNSFTGAEISTPEIDCNYPIKVCCSKE